MSSADLSDLFAFPLALAKAAYAHAMHRAAHRRGGRRAAALQAKYGVIAVPGAVVAAGTGGVGNLAVKPVVPDYLTGSVTRRLRPTTRSAAARSRRPNRRYGQLSTGCCRWRALST